MKIKINWGWAIVIAMGAFMIFILQFLFRSITDESLEHHLVSEDYYKDELYYQEEIDKLNNASKLKENLTVKRTEGGMLITFPKSIDIKNVTGTVSLLKNSDKRLDFKKEIKLIGNTMLINDEKLIGGKWNIKIIWNLNDVDYMYKEAIFY